MDQPTAERIAAALERIAIATEEQVKLHQTMLSRVNAKSDAEKDLHDVRYTVVEIAEQLGFRLTADEEE